MWTRSQNFMSSYKKCTDFRTNLHFKYSLVHCLLSNWSSLLRAPLVPLPKRQMLCHTMRVHVLHLKSVPSVLFIHGLVRRCFLCLLLERTLNFCTMSVMACRTQPQKLTLHTVRTEEMRPLQMSTCRAPVQCRHVL